MLDRYCVMCHSKAAHTANIVLEKINVDDVSQNAPVWEKVLLKLKTGEMPPPKLPKPDAETRTAFVTWLETSLDRAAAEKPNPGMPSAHRLNRAEYGNAIRDLLSLDINAGSLLPADDSGYGFDNIADVLSVSPLLLERYMSAARKISRLAVGDPHIKPAIDQYPIPRSTGPQDTSQKIQVSEDLPFGSRGGIAIRHYFPVDGVYNIRILMRPTGDADDKPIHEVKIPVKAGARLVGVTFLGDATIAENEAPAVDGKAPAAKMNGAPPPAELDVRVDDARVKLFDLPGGKAAIDSVWIGGPYEITGSGETASRKRIFSCHPANPNQQSACAAKIVTDLARHAYRRPVTDADMKPLLALYADGAKQGGFEHGIEMALRAILVSPDFLFRMERDPAGAAPGTLRPLNDFELASRLSFFLWSSIPDDELLNLAQQNQLNKPDVLKQQVRRMLADPKSQALVTNFAGQWLYLRNLPMVRPDPESFPEFDNALRENFQRETELFIGAILHEDHSVFDLINANFTFLNERLAKHYGIPGVYGNAFRRVTLNDPRRGGLLGQGAILTVTSYPNRTSPVLRGKWILENLLGAPPPPPPPGIPELKSHSEEGKLLTAREQMELHRANPTCASCHARMDPLGFSMENFDGVGRWRNKDAGAPIDVSAVMPDGTKFDGPAGLKKVLLSHRDEFVDTVTEKLLTYALGRGLEYYDLPTVRAIAKDAAKDDDRMSALITSIAESTPFRMRRTAEP